MADFQSIGNSESCRDMLNSLVTGAAIMRDAAFKNMGSRPSRPADLFVFSLESSSWTSEVEKGIKEKPLLLDGIQIFFRGACLLIIRLKVFLKKDHASSKRWKELILSQDTAATSWRKACMSSFFKERLVTITGGLLNERPERTHAIAQ